MGYVIKEKPEPVFIRLKDLSIIEEKNEALNLLKINEAQQRIRAIIIVYSEIDFNDFYRKHCARIPNDENEFTVLVRKKESIPTRGEIRKLLEDLLKIRFKIEKGELITDIFEERGFFVRKYFNNTFLTEPIKGCFKFERITVDFPKQKLEYLKNKNILTEEQYERIDSLWKSSFTEKGKYFFEKILVIEHTGVIIKKKILF